MPEKNKTYCYLFLNSNYECPELHEKLAKPIFRIRVIGAIRSLEEEKFEVLKN